MQLGHKVDLGPVDFDTAIERVTAALKTEGFGVLTEIDVKATLKKKLDVDFRPYRILGACNPPFAHAALSAEPSVGLLLPCNVVVEEVDGSVHVSMIRPEALLSVMEGEDLAGFAAEVGARVERIIASLA